MNQQELNDQLYVSVRDNKPEKVREYLKQGAEIDHKDGNVLYTTVILDNYEMARLLIDAGADPTVSRCKPMRSALFFGKPAMLEILLEANGAKEHFRDELPNALKLATDKNEINNASIGVIQKLLDIGLDVHYLDDAAVKNSVIGNMPEITDLLLENGANFHASGDYAFRQAAIKGYDKVLEVAIIKHDLTPTQESLVWMKEKDCLKTVEQLMAKRELNKKLQANLTPKPTVKKSKMKDLGMKI